MTDTKKPAKYGVIVGRFQTPYLTHGHKFLINSVYKKHDVVVIYIGCHVTQPTRRNALDYKTREAMILDYYPEALVIPIADVKPDDRWYSKLDRDISNYAGDENAVLYGCRDSFIEGYKKYNGKYDSVEIENTPFDISATEIRKQCIQHPINSKDFRTGVIYGISKRFPSPYMCVDVALLRNNRTEVLMGSKIGDEGLRFFGGFLDSSDASITNAAHRELIEEIGPVEVDNFKLIGEAKIPNWRYENDDEKVFTNLFTCNYIFGHPKGQDDMEGGIVEWVKISDLSTVTIIPEHHVLRDILYNYLTIKQ